MTDTEAETTSVAELLMLSVESRIGRIATAAEKTETSIRRVADALETLTGLIASVIGVGRATCYPPESNGDITTPLVNYIRAGKGERFHCDAAGDNDDE